MMWAMVRVLEAFIVHAMELRFNSYMLDAIREFCQTGVIWIVFLQLSVIFNSGLHISITWRAFKNTDIPLEIH